MKVYVRFVFDGQAHEALIFYSKVFNGEIKDIFRFGDIKPDESRPDEMYKERIMNARLVFNNESIHFCDQMPGDKIVKGNNMLMDVFIPAEVELKRVFEALSEGGKVLMPLEPTFWTPLFGMVTDKFGITWNLMQM